LAGVVRIHFDHDTAVLLGFVRQKLFQLVKGPADPFVFLILW
jgi:hypothetical protein